MDYAMISRLRLVLDALERHGRAGIAIRDLYAQTHGDQVEMGHSEGRQLRRDLDALAELGFLIERGGGMCQFGGWRERTMEGTIRWSARQRDLSISEELLAQLDYPKVLIIEPLEGGGLILYQRGDPRATGKERKVNYPQRAMPRISIGELAIAELGLRDGRYRGAVQDQTIVAYFG